MKLRVIQSVQNANDVFLFTIDQTSISSNDMDLFNKFGPQPINFGGTVSVYSSYNANGSGISSATETFVLPDLYYDLPTAFPVQQTFSATSPSPFATNTANRLLAYKQGICYAVYTAVTNLRNTSDTFTGEFIVNI